MANSPHRNDFFNGNKGVVWVDGVPVLTCYKARAVRKIVYEELPAPSGDGTVRVKTGETIEVSLSYRYTGKEDLDVFNSAKDISVIIANTNINDQVTKRIKLDGVTFDEEVLAEFEKKKVGEIELTGQAETQETLQDK